MKLGMSPNDIVPAQSREPSTMSERAQIEGDNMVDPDAASRTIFQGRGRGKTITITFKVGGMPGE